MIRCSCFVINRLSEGYSRPFTALSPGVATMLVPSSTPFPPRPVRILRQMARLLQLRLLLAICLRIGIVTALVSGIGYRLINPQLRRYPGAFGAGVSYGVGDAAYAAWLILSPAFFFPCAILIDLGVCVIIAWRIRALHVLFFLNQRNQGNPMISLIALDSFIEFLSVLCIGFLRILGVCIAMVEAYYLAQQSERSPRRAVFDLIVRSQYDWWTFRPLPDDFMSRKWYRRIWRPWFPFGPPASSLPQEHKPKVTPLLSVFFGTKTFHARRGERLWFVILRGLTALGCLGAVVAYATNVLFFQPLDENTGPPIQLQRLSSMPTQDKMPAPTWGVIVGINTRYAHIAPEVTLGDLISVNPEAPSSAADIPGCSSTAFTSPQEALSTFQLVSYQCPILWINEALVYTPQIRISIDYAAVNLSRSYFSPEGSLKVWPSFTDDFIQVLQSTQPVSLVMGNNLIASVTGTLRSSFSTPTQAMFGFNPSMKTYVKGQLTVLGNDPLSPAPIPAGTVATMRIFKELRSTDWELYTDTRQHTILTGLSSVGGLSVFVNSVFIILFGGSLMLVLFDIKPLSIFGLFHFFSRSTLSERFTADFPRLRDEGGQAGHSGSGLVAFMREYMLDLTILPPESKSGDAMVCGTRMGNPTGDLVLDTQDCDYKTKDGQYTSMPSL